jgi:ketosteroid isomerase-like protein
MDSGGLAEAAFAALARRDFDGFLELMDPNVEFTSLIQESEAKLYCGHQGVRQFLDQMLSVFPDWSPTVESTESHGDSALVKVRFEGTGVGSGMTVEQVGWQVAHARDGRVIGWCFFRTEEEAREALVRNLSAGEVAAAAGGSAPPRSPHPRP